ncbi:hypothetical protein SEA_SONALI_44 [Arthrobacter phage Sonali]|uniref:Uncharacterized protein n=1 Tax=Arthrobacter phage Sonali TaxID=2510495 RepID=A0A411CQS3_9CAUD|nr:hypothetical protein HOV09_gp44 [Arthrobacter phage Sonali]QAY16156.1 hypothetical protein SEA_SONALI_44 [Arthrobacter phage Sonali]
MNPTLEATQTGSETYEVAARPDKGIPVTLYVVPALVPRRGRVYDVKRNPDPNTTGYITRHSTFEVAAKAATSRAKKYLASYARAEKRRLKAGQA